MGYNEGVCVSCDEVVSESNGYHIDVCDNCNSYLCKDCFKETRKKYGTKKVNYHSGKAAIMCCNCDPRQPTEANLLKFALKLLGLTKDELLGKFMSQM